MKTLKARIIDKILVDYKGCWVWQGAKFSVNKPYGAYGMLRLGKKTARAHRISYEVYVGEIPKDKELDHLCKNTLCVNPQHLEPVSHFENIRRSRNTIKTHCKNGHHYSKNNTIINARGARECRICRKLRKK